MKNFKRALAVIGLAFIFFTIFVLMVTAANLVAAIQGNYCDNNFFLVLINLPFWAILPVVITMVYSIFFIKKNWNGIEKIANKMFV